ncbi:MAG: translocation/assembly module TamB domain-containing protein [Geminicoccaceae bacterium]|nr:translocation/assembly module TamB domain-containing protein [Geminicoccaceae bacterium]
MIRKLGRIALYSVLLMIVLIGIAFGALQTRFARDKIATLIQQALTDENQTAEVDGLGGLLPFDIRLASFRLADSHGIWLEVDDARLETSPWRLISRQVVIDRLGATRIAVLRSPDLPPSEPQPDQPFSLPQPPDLPESLPVALDAGEIRVDRIELGEPLLGEAMTLTLDGGVRTTDNRDRLDARVDIHRTDKDTLGAVLGVNIDLAKGDIGVQADIRENGGLVARLSKIEEAGPLNVTLRGNGPLSSWRAKLDMAAEGLVKGGIQLGLQYTDTPDIDLAAEIIPSSDLVPRKFADLVGDSLNLDLKAGIPAPGQVKLERLKVRAALLTVDGKASASLDDNTFDGSITANVENLDRLSQLAGTSLGGTASLVLNAVGTFDNPAIEVNLDGSDLSGADFLAQTIEGRFDLALLSPLNEGFKGMDAKGGMTIQGLEQGGQPLRPEDSLTLALDAHLPLEGQAVVRQLEVVGQHVDLNATAQLDMPSLAGPAAIRLGVNDLAGLIHGLGPMAPQGLKISGSANLLIDAKIGEQAKEIDADITLNTKGIAGIPGGADGVVGSTPGLTAKARFVQGQRVEVKGLDVHAASASLKGDLALGLDKAKALGGRIVLDVPALSAFNDLAKQQLGGKVAADIKLAGSLSAPQVNAHAEISKLIAADQSFDRITLDATSSGPADKLGGKVALEAEQFSHVLSLSSEYILTPQSVNLSELKLSGPATDIAGDLAVDLKSRLASGNLKGGISDLSALEPWLRQGFTGALDVDVALSGNQGQQDAAAKIRIPTLSGSFGDVTGLDVDATVKDALGKLGVDGRIGLAHFSQPGLDITSATVNVGGDLDMLTLKANAEGQQQKDKFNIDTEARLSIKGEKREIYLDRLTGRAAGQDISLRSPAKVILDNGDVNVDKLDLVVGDARIEGNATMGKGRIDGHIQLGTLPLSMLASFGAPQLTGTAKGDLKLTGTTSKPAISLALNLDGVKPGDPFYTKKPGFGADINAKIDSGRMALDVSVDGMSPEPGKITLTIPLKLTLEPFAFDLASNAPLDGKVNAKLDMGQLSLLASLDGQRVSGIIDVDLAIGGRLDRPLLDGSMILDNGQFLDAASGFALVNTRMRLEAKGQSINIAKLEATDGATGRIGLSGSANIDMSGRLPFDIKLTSKGMRVLESDLGTAFVTSDLSIKGNKQSAAIKGKVNLDSANLQIPGGGAIDPVKLDVIEIGKGTDAAANRNRKPQRPAPAYKLSLDIDFQAPSKLFVRGRGVESEWGGSLDITGTATNPSIAGSIDFRRGYVDFLDRRFDIRKGQISFSGDIIPNIEITAAAQGEQLVGVITITGPATKPDLELSSEPDRPQDEILADLLFKRDISSITPAQGLRLAAAVRTLEGGGPGTIGRLRDAVGLDTLDVGSDDTGGATAKAGKYIADGVFLEVERGIASGSGKATVEIELTDNITVNTEVNENAQTGVGIEWSLDY